MIISFANTTFPAIFCLDAKASCSHHGKYHVVVFHAEKESTILGPVCVGNGPQHKPFEFFLSFDLKLKQQKLEAMKLPVFS